MIAAITCQILQAHQYHPSNTADDYYFNYFPPNLQFEDYLFHPETDFKPIIPYYLKATHNPAKQQVHYPAKMNNNINKIPDYLLPPKDLEASYKLAEYRPFKYH